MRLKLRDPRSLRSRKRGARMTTGPAEARCPHARQSRARAGRREGAVEAGQGILVVEAMKMQNEIKSPKKGIVQKFAAARRRQRQSPATCWRSSSNGCYFDAAALSSTFSA